MITGDLRIRIDRLWEAFWSGGIANPLEAVEQITYLMFLRRLGESGGGGATDPGRLRWAELPRSNPAALFATVRDEVFPWLRALGGTDSAYAEHMREARFTIPTSALLAKAVDLLDRMTFDGDTEGDLYEYMLSKIATAGQNGQFRTPRHIIELVVAMLAPGPEDEICDPACGTAGFLVAAAGYVRRRHGVPPRRGGLHGFDFDTTMLRIASMNMLTHDVDPEISYRDALAAGIAPGSYSMVLANPPFAGSVDTAGVDPDLTAAAPTRQSELLFLALILRVLKPGGRAAVIVPEGVLFGSGRAHTALRTSLVEEHRLDAVVKLPSGVFKPYSGVSTAILLFTAGGVTDHVWFYDVRADGFRLDDRRTPAPAEDDLPDVLRRWPQRDGSERERERTEQSFRVPREEIAARAYDLTLHRYRVLRPAPVRHRPVSEIVADIERLEARIQRGVKEIRRLVDER